MKHLTVILNTANPEANRVSPQALKLFAQCFLADPDKPGFFLFCDKDSPFYVILSNQQLFA
jgi:hypothetical protein